MLQPVWVFRRKAIPPGDTNSVSIPQGIERRFLAICRWHVATGVGFPQKSEYADVAHLVERHLAKVEVASSSLVIRSIWYHSQVVRRGTATP